MPTVADRLEHLPARTRILNARWASRLGARRAIIALFALGACAAILLASVTAASDRTQTRLDAGQRLDSAARLVEAHMVGVIDAAEQVAARAAHLAEEAGPHTLVPRRDLHVALREMAASLPGIVSVAIVDATGRAVLGARAFPGGDIDVSDRDYFRSLRAGADVHVGHTIVGRRVRDYVFTVARRLEARDGRFAGVALVTLDAGQLAGAYAGSGLEPSASFVVLHADGGYITGFPLMQAAVERSFADRPLFTTHIPAAPAGQFRAIVPISGDDRLVSYRAAERAPIVVVTSLAWDAIFARWRDRTLRTVLLTAGGLASAGALLWLALAALAREERSRGALAAANAELAAALADKDVLFREVHHRVTNNLQIVGGLVQAQLLRAKDPDGKAALAELVGRVRAMALLHRTLYRGDDAVEVDLGGYLEDLGEAMRTALDLEARGIRLVIEADPLRLDLDRAVPIGLAISEAITNASKHAFPGGRAGTIRVRAGVSDGATAVEIADDGIGGQAGDGAAAGDAAPEAAGIGGALIERLAAQAGARLEIRREHGYALRLLLGEKAG
ncbi:MAG: sensor histidine kinase [Salinarimonas sp.]